MNGANYLNQIVEAGVPGDVFSNCNDETPHKSFGFGHAGVSFVGPNLTIFDESVRQLYSLDRSIADSFTLKRFESEVVEFVQDRIHSRKKIEKQNEREFFHNLIKKPLQKYFVLREVYGLVLRNSVAPLRLGPFVIYHLPSHEALINAKTDVPHDRLWAHKPPEYLIETATQARHFEKAKDKADLLFEKFELLLQYAIGFSNRYEVGVLNYLGWRNRRAYIFPEDRSFSISHSNHGAIEPIPIDDEYFQDTDLGFDRMWGSVASMSNSETSKRLLLSIEWAAQAYREPSPASAFLKAAIALEIIFTQNEKTLINASILSQIAENAAVLLGGDAKERIEIESTLKNLYSKRSAIAHAGKTQIDEEDLYSIFDLSRRVIFKLMTHKDLKKLERVADIHAYLKNRKYSCPPV